MYTKAGQGSSAGTRSEEIQLLLRDVAGHILLVFQQAAKEREIPEQLLQLQCHLECGNLSNTLNLIRQAGLTTPNLPEAQLCRPAR